MLYGKLRIHTCRIILLTSLVWFLVDVVVLSFYSECLGGACKKTEDLDSSAQRLVMSASDYEKVDENERIDSPDRYVANFLLIILESNQPTNFIFQNILFCY